MEFTASKKAIISINNLSKKYKDLIAVNQLCLEIYEHEILGFLGPNGAGKTTCIQLICGLIAADGGSIEFHLEKNNKSPQQNIGICPQENVFWPKLTCIEQLVFAGEMYGIELQKSKKRAHELLEWLGLNEKTNTVASKLSGGMKRRLNICLALMHDPEILILDEPEAGLDPQSKVLVRNFIKSLAGTKTIILTTHNMDEADRLSDRIAIIDQGKLLKTGSPKSLKQSIGTGDLLEIVFDHSYISSLTGIKNSLEKLNFTVTEHENKLILYSKNIMQKITEVVQQINIPVQQMNMRENSLEDVFIHLTGKKLRQ